MFQQSKTPSVGDYDVTLPADTVSGDYKIRVGLFDDQELFGCCGTFEIVSESDGGGGLSFNFEIVDDEGNWSDSDETSP